MELIKQIPCLWDGISLEIKLGILDEKGDIVSEFRNKTLENGVYVSPCGSPYCSLEHYVHFCED